MYPLTSENVRNLLKLMEPLSGLKPETFRLRIVFEANISIPHQTLNPFNSFKRNNLAVPSWFTKKHRITSDLQIFVCKIVCNLVSLVTHSKNPGLDFNINSLFKKDLYWDRSGKIDYMRVVYLIRHGESEANAGLVTYNPAKVRLTLEGKKQSQLICKFFSHPPSLIVTSTFLRTKETALPTLERFPTVREEVWEVQEFTYLSYLKMPSMTISQRRPEVSRYWKFCDLNYLDGEQCESFVTFVDRVKTILKRLKNSSHKTVAIFTHGQFIKALLWYHLTQPQIIQTEHMRNFFYFMNSHVLPNGAIIKLCLYKNELFRIGKVITNHLNG